jgi:hypothetical protein
MMRSSYKKEDVTLLLKDITGFVEPLPTQAREAFIQQGVHYCEMLPLEYQPSPKYLSEYENALQMNAVKTAEAVVCVSEKIYREKSGNIVLVSLARAGTPVGVLIKRCLEMKYHISVYHYTISIIRGVGIDRNAMKYILDRHSAESVQFVDGWTGKGAILKTLKKELDAYSGVSQKLAVLADPANITDLCGTKDDFLIPSSILNSTVSGLISRTFLRKDIIGENDFHGAVYYGELSENDRTYEFIDTVMSKITPEMSAENTTDDSCLSSLGIDEVKKIAADFGISDINLIKPSIGEATRVLLRRVPWRLLISDSLTDISCVRHLLRLAEEKGVAVEKYPLKRYKACGIIKELSSADA